MREVLVHLRDVRGAIAAREPTTVELMACAGFLHNVYNGIENCLLRVAHAVDESVPTGSESHRLLLDQMSAPLDAIRPAVIDEALLRRIDEYRRFRHAFRHMYFFDLDWERVRPLVEDSDAIAQAFEAALDTMLDTIEA